MTTGTWVVRIHASPYHMYYTGEEAHGHSAWSFDPAKAARFDTEVAAEATARSLARWLNSVHRTVVQMPERQG